VIRLVVADDQELVRDGFCSILSREPDLQVAGQAADGVEASPRPPAPGPMWCCSTSACR